MNLIIKSAVSTALLTVAAVSAHAQLATAPTPPATYPAATAITPGGNNTTPGNGGLFVQAFDVLTGKSLTEYLGINYNAFQPGVVTAAGGTTDFGIVGGASLWNATFSGDTNPIQFIVVSANNATSGSTSILTTLSPGTSATQRNGAIANAASHLASAVGTLTAGQSSTPSQAPGANPAQTLSTSDNGYGVVTNLGQSYGGTLSNTIYGVAGGTGVGFYRLSQTSTNTISNGTFTQYGNATGVATFSMSASGDLVFTVPGTGGGGGGGTTVPLPAAAWLLGSGLLGLAGIGRRRAAAKA